MVRAARALVLLPLLALGPASVAAQPIVVVPGQGDPVVTSCRFDLRLFRSLRHGTLEYCRGHLRFVPGALDCYRFVDEVCTVFLPASATLAETRRDGAPGIFRCPEGPAPPVCPRLGVR